MKNEKGITIISLIIYVIALTLVIAGISAMTSSFYKNIKEFDKTSESAVAFAKFNMYFINDIKSKDVVIDSVSSNEVQLSLKNKNGETENVKYSVQNGNLYRNKVKICDKVTKVSITSTSDKKTITIDIKINDYEKKTTYAIENNKSDNSIIS